MTPTAAPASPLQQYVRSSDGHHISLLTTPAENGELRLLVVVLPDRRGGCSLDLRLLAVAELRADRHPSVRGPHPDVRVLASVAASPTTAMLTEVGPLAVLAQARHASATGSYTVAVVTESSEPGCRPARRLVICFDDPEGAVALDLDALVCEDLAGAVLAPASLYRSKLTGLLELAGDDAELAALPL
jgi:hypothetical protein